MFTVTDMQYTKNDLCPQCGKSHSQHGKSLMPSKPVHDGSTCFSEQHGAPLEVLSMARPVDSSFCWLSVLLECDHWVGRLFSIVRRLDCARVEIDNGKKLTYYCHVSGDANR